MGAGKLFPRWRLARFIAGTEEGGGPTLAVLHGGEGWGLNVGTTWVTVDVALLLDPETGEGWTLICGTPAQ
jgi:hypothetical protein